MAAPAIGSIGTFLGGANGSSALIPVPASVAAGDIIIVFLYKENTQTVTAPAGFTEITPAATTTAPQEQHAYWKRATAADTGTYSFTWSSPIWRDGVAVRITGALGVGSPIDVSNSAGRSTSGTTTPGVTVTTTGTDRLLLWSATSFTGGTWTVPSTGGTWTNLTSGTDDPVAWKTQPVAGSTGSLTGVCSGSGAQTAWVIALLPAFTLISSADSGTGTDALTLARTSSITDSGTGTDTPAVLRSSAVSDAATGTDSATVTQLVGITDTGTGTDSLFLEDIVFKAVSDSGTGTESVFVDIPALISSSDTGTGTDVLTIAPVANSFETGAGTEALTIIRSSSISDAGIGSDTTTVLRGSTVADSATLTESFALTAQQGLSDSGVGSESISILRFSTVTDSAIGTETLNPGPNVFDFGTGTEVLSLLDIPFTQILPLRQLTVYDLVVVARVPQVNAPPTFIEVDPIEWKSLTYTNTLSQPQELSASCQISSLTQPVLQRLRNLADLATELWLYRNGKIVFAGPIQGFQTSGEDLTISCKGLLAYLRLMLIQQDLVFTQIDQSLIVKSMVDQWQNLDYGNFGIDTSGITPSGTLRDGTYLKTELHNVGQRVEDLGKLAGGFDAEVDPATRKLFTWAPKKGVDRSTGENAIVIDSRNITSGDIVCSVAIGDLASESFTTGTASGADSTLFSTKTNAELRSKYGRSGISATFSDVSAQAILDSYAQALVDARGAAFLIPGPKVRVTPDADLADYGVGDLIAYELGSTLSVSGSFRIRKQSITASSSGQEAVDLEFV